jgi:hypothetical protein
MIAFQQAAALSARGPNSRNRQRGAGWRLLTRNSPHFHAINAQCPVPPKQKLFADLFLVNGSPQSHIYQQATALVMRRHAQAKLRKDAKVSAYIAKARLSDRGRGDGPTASFGPGYREEDPSGNRGAGSCATPAAAGEIAFSARGERWRLKLFALSAVPAGQSSAWSAAITLAAPTVT